MMRLAINLTNPYVYKREESEILLFVSLPLLQSPEFNVGSPDRHANEIRKCNIVCLACKYNHSLSQKDGKSSL
jgi:hypothetical protein